MSASITPRYNEIFQKDGRPNLPLSTLNRRIWGRIFRYIPAREQVLCMSVCQKWRQDQLTAYMDLTFESFDLLTRELLEFTKAKQDQTPYNSLLALQKDLDQQTKLNRSFMGECIAPRLFTLAQILARASLDIPKGLKSQSVAFIEQRVGLAQFQAAINVLGIAYNIVSALSEEESSEQLIHNILEINSKPITETHHPLSPGRKLACLLLNELGALLKAMPQQMNKVYSQMVSDLRKKIEYSGDKEAAYRRLARVVPPNLVPNVIDLLLKELKENEALAPACFLLTTIPTERASLKNIEENLKVRLARLPDSFEKRTASAYLVKAKLFSADTEDVESIAKMALNLQACPASDDVLSKTATRLNSHPLTGELLKKIGSFAKRLAAICQICCTTASVAKFQLYLKNIEDLMGHCKNDQVTSSIVLQSLQSMQLSFPAHHIERKRSVSELLQKFTLSAKSPERASLNGLKELLSELYRKEIPQTLSQLLEQVSNSQSYPEGSKLLKQACALIAQTNPSNSVEAGDLKGKTFLYLFQSLATGEVPRMKELNVDLIVKTIDQFDFPQDIRNLILCAISVHLCDDELSKAITFICAINEPQVKGKFLGELYYQFIEDASDLNRYMANMMRAIPDAASRDSTLEAYIQVLTGLHGCFYYGETIAMTSLLSTKEKRVAKLIEILKTAQECNHIDPDFLGQLEKEYKTLKSPMKEHKEFWSDLLSAANALKLPLTKEILERVPNTPIKEITIKSPHNSFKREGIDY